MVTQIIVTGGAGYQTVPSVTIATPIQAGALSISYASPATTGTLTYTPVPNAFGTATITVTVMDNGGTVGGGQDTTVTTFLVTVNPVNQAPTIGSIASPAPILENTTAAQSVSLTGITAGAGESQVLTITAASSNTGLIPNPIVSYTSPNTVGTLTYSVVPNASGTAVISVTVMDNGPTPAANALNVNAVTQTFTVTVTPVNQAPTLNAIANPPAVVVNSGTQTIQLTGISTGLGDSGQNIVSVSATVNTASATATLNGDTVGSIAVNYGGAGYASSPVVTLTGGGFTTAAAATAILNGSGIVTGFTITSPGSGYTSAPLVTIASPATALIAISPISYTNPNSTGTLTYTPEPNATGSATITVTVTDSGGTANGGVNTVSQTFIVAVAPANLAPVVTTTASALAYTQGQAPAAIDPGLTLQDNNTPTNPTIVGATIQITSNYNPGQDVLSFNPQNGISASFNSVTGTLTLSGPATIGNYQTALRTVTYFNSSTNPAPLTRLVTFTVDDGAAVNNLGAGSRTINLTAVNVAPTLSTIANPAPIFESATPTLQTIDLSGISPGGGQNQTITSITATSGNTNLIPGPTINYASPNTSGSLSYTPVASTFGTTTISVTVTDSGGNLNGGVATTTQVFTVTVLPVNQPPTLTAIANPAAILENTATKQTIPLLAITAGPNETQNLTISAVSSNPGLIPNPGINYTSPNSSGSLSYAPVPFMSGQAIILVTVMDDGGSANGGISTLTRSFTITVTPVNQPPALNPLSDNTLTENNLAPQTVNLSGINDGNGDTGQVLSVSAVSSNQSLVPNPTVTYTNPNTTGTLTYSLAPNASGKATITVTVTDDGGTANGGVNTFSQTFNVIVTQVNQAPTLNPIANVNPILENSAGETISLGGITAGPGDVQTLTIQVTNLTPALIATPTVSYISPNSTGTLTIVPVQFVTGTAMFEVSVLDSGGTANGGVNVSAPQLITVPITPVNQPPQITPIGSVTVLENSPGLQTVSLTGISTGTGDVGQSIVSISATSSNTNLIPNPAITYTNPASTGTLTYTVLPNVSGTAVITVSVMDNGGTVNGGKPLTTDVFTITVAPLNETPTLNPISPNPLILPLSPGQQSVPLSGISDGQNSPPTALTVTVTSSNPALIPNSITGAAATATLNGTSVGALTLVAGGSGYGFTPTVTITGGGNGTGATATVTMSGGVVTGITLGNPGSGYTSIPTVQIAPPLATATATATVLGGTVNGFTITNGGAGYLSPPVVTLAGGGSSVVPPTLTANLTNGVVTSISIVGGSGYNTPPSVSIAAPLSTATATTALGAGGTLNPIAVTNGGSGYLSPPTVTFSGAVSTIPATATAVLGTGTTAGTVVGINFTGPVTSITLGSGGSGYINSAPGHSWSAAVTSLPPQPRVPCLTNGTTVTGITLTGPVTSIAVTNGGSGYTIPPTVALNGGGGTGATAIAILNTSGAVVSIVITAPGSGYTSAPTVQISGGDGSGVTATAAITTGGSGYTSAPTVVFNGGGGNGATATAGITTGGSGYTTVPTITIGNPERLGALAVVYTSPRATGAFTFTPVAGASGNATLTVTVTDQGSSANGGANSVQQTLIVQVNPSHLPPVITNSPGSLPYFQGAAPTAIDPGVTVTDSDSNTIASASVAIAVGLAPAEDRLALSPNPQNGIAATYNATTGVLNLTGVASIAAYQQALQSVTYQDISTNPSPQVRVLTFSANDGFAVDGIGTSTRTITVTPVNVAPTLNAITPNTRSIVQDSGTFITVNLTGITAGGGQIQNLNVTAVSNNTALIDSPIAVSYTSPNTTGSLSFTSLPGASGTATITVTVTDDGGTANGGVNMFSQTFTVNVVPINVPPTLNPITSPAPLLENTVTATATATIPVGGGALTASGLSVTYGGAGYVTPPLVTLSGGGATSPATASAVLGTGANAGTVVGFTLSGIYSIAVNVGGTGYSSLNPPTVTISAPTGTNPVPATATAVVNSSGVVTSIVITNAGSGYTSAPTITIAPPQSGTTATAAATLDNAGAGYSSAPTVSIAGPTGLPTINLTGITSGGGAAQLLSVVAISSNPALIPTPSITYSSPNSTGSLTFSAQPNLSGTAVITVTVTDNGGTTSGGVNTFSQQFTVTVNPVNQAPTLTTIANPAAILENAGTQSVVISGIGSGVGDPTQSLTVTASSGNVGLIPNVAVTYTSPQTVGALTYTPVANVSGSAVIFVTITDNGGTANGGVNSITRSFTVTVTPVNQQPTLNVIPNPAPILEDTLTATATATVSPVDGSISGLTVTYGGAGYQFAPNVTLNGGGFSNPATATAILTNGVVTGFTLSGIASIAVANGGSGYSSLSPPTVTIDAPTGANPVQARAFAIVNSSGVVTSIVINNAGSGYITVPNITIDAPSVGGVPATATATATIDSAGLGYTSVPTVVIDPPGNLPTIQLSGITAGAGEQGQVLTITATSNNTALIPNPTIDYTSPDSTGLLVYSPVANVSGTALITVNVTDNGGVTNGGVNTIQRTFLVVVTAVNQPPTLAAIASPAAILENTTGATSVTVNLTGIGGGPGDVGQTLTVVATSSNPTLVPNPTVAYTNPATTGTLTYAPSAFASGSAVITVTVFDSSGSTFSQTFTVTVTPINQAPTIDTIANPAPVAENSIDLPPITLTGISAGLGDSGQIVNVFATSSNAALIFNPSVTYTSPNSTGSLSYTVSPNASGTAVITVVVTDNGGTANGGVSTTSTTFNVVVNPIDQQPTLSFITNPPAIAVNATRQTINLAGISAGVGDPTTQTVTITATSSNPGLIPNPTVTYTNPSKTGTLTYTPVANSSGTAVITVTVMDNGDITNGGTNIYSQSFVVAVAPAHLPPQITTTSTGSLNFVQGDPETPIDPNITITDPDSPTIQSVTVQITGNYNPTEDILDFTDPTGGQVTTTGFNASNGTLTLTAAPGASVTPSIFSQALDAVTYQDINIDTPSTLLRTIEFTVNDGAASNNTVSSIRTINVSQLNVPPTITPISPPAITGIVDSPLVTIPLSGITAGANQLQNLKVTVTSGTGLNDTPGLIPTPTLIYTSPNTYGSFTFQPVANAFGTSTIVVTVTDSLGDVSPPIDLFVTVVPVNQAPTLTAIANPPAVLEFTTAPTVVPPVPPTINLAGITAGVGDSQNLTVTAVVETTAQAPGTNPSIIAPLTPTGSFSIAVTGGGSGYSSASPPLVTIGAPPAGGTQATATAVVDSTGVVTSIIITNAGLGYTAVPTITIAAPGGNGTTATAAATSLVLTYTPNNPTGMLNYNLSPFQSGTAVIAVTVTDDGGTTNGGVKTVTQTFTVTVTPVNQPPTLNAIANPAPINENTSGLQTVRLRGITAGTGDTKQLLIVSASSSNTALVAPPSDTYTSPGTAGTITYSILPNVSGTATITVTVTDNGGTSNGGVNTIQQSFTVTVLPVNQQPVINTIANSTVLQNGGPTTINFTGVGAGAGDIGQSLTVTATSSNPSVIPTPSVSYTSASATGSLSFTPVKGAVGSSVITVTVTDNGPSGVINGALNINTFNESFTVTVTPVNEAPTLNPIQSPSAILENSGPQSINISGITAGAGESQFLTITATSGNTSLIPNPTVNYNSPDTAGYLIYSPAPNISGTAVITVTVTDNGGVANSGVNSFAQSFLVTVLTVDQAPTLDPIKNPAALALSAGQQTIGLTGIGPGNGDAGQLLTVTVSSDNPALILNPGGGAGALALTYVQGSATGTLTYTPVAGVSGTADISVTVMDNGNTTNNGINTITRTFSVVVAPSNLGPVVTTTAANLAYLQGQAPVAVDPGVTVTDAGSSNIISAEVVIANNFAAGQDILAFTNQGGITGSYNAATGELDLLGIATPALYQAALRSVTYQNLSTNPSTLNRNIEFEVNDGAASNNIGLSFRTVTVTAVNVAPTLNPIGLPAATATASLVTDAFGNATIAINVNNGGSGYSSANPPIVTLTGGTFSTVATATAVVTNGVVTEIDVTGGTGYTVVPTVKIAPPPPAAIFENAGTQTVDLGGITAGGGVTSQTLTVTATSSNTALIANPTVSYISPASTGSLTYTPVANASGTATISVLVTDSGGTANGGVNTVVQTFTVTVVPFNQPPALAAITNPAAILENAGPQQVNLSGISSGTGDPTQFLTVTAVSTNPALIPNTGPGSVAVSYTSPGTTAQLSYAPLPGASGTAAIIVTVMDSGGTATGGFNLISRSFVVTVTPVNQQPTLDPINNPTPVNENSITALNPGTITLTGISTGQGDVNQLLTFTAVSNNTGLVPNPTISYTNGSSTATLSYIPAANASGSAVITVTATDNGGVANGGINTISRQFTVTILPVNQPPTINPIPNPATINEIVAAPANPPSVTINLSGITSGKGNSGEVVTITATSDNPTLINPTVNYTYPNTTGTITYTPAVFGFGTADITVTVMNSGSTANGGQTTTTETFTASIRHVNQPPDLTAIPNSVILPVSAPEQVVPLMGIDPGPGDPLFDPNLATATARATVTGGVVNTITVTNTGNYTIVPTVTLTGGGTGAKFVPATAVAVLGTAANGTAGQVVMIQITSPGAGYTTAPTVTISAPTQGQFVKLTATSNNPNLIASERVVYTNPSTTGTLFYDLKPGASGVAIITVTASDDGGTANGGKNTLTQSFTVTVTPLNHAPTINAVKPVSLIENSAQQTIPLSGITDGDAGTQIVTSVTATSTNTALIPNPVVTYTNPDTTGTLTYTPIPGSTGTATITLTVTDDGGTANGGINATSETFVITVVSINHSPTLDPIVSPAPIFENAPAQTISLTGIGDGDNMTQITTVTAVSSVPTLIANPTVNYTNPGSTGTLTYMPVPNASGTAKITVTVQDNGGTANGGINTFSQVFTVVVTAVNQQPTINTVPSVSILENSGTQTVGLSAISPGLGDTGQTLTIAATSSNPNLIPNPAITYTNPSKTGVLTYTPTAFLSGSAVITITEMDSGGVANGGINTNVETFTVVVLPVDQAPTLDPITSPAPMLEGSAANPIPAQVINLTGISPGQGDSGQVVSISAISSNPGLIPNPIINYTNPNTTGTLIYQPTVNSTGTATISVIVKDNGGTANGGHDTFIQSFLVTITGINHMPTINAAPSTTASNVSLSQILENSGPQTINLSGITDGMGDVNQTVMITATSSNSTLIPNPSIAYNSPNTTGTLSFTPVAFATGTTTVTVTLVDNGGTANGGVNTNFITFNLTVIPVNQPPTLTTIGNPPAIPENTAGVQTVSLSGITTGQNDTGQSITSVTATSNNPNLITSPTVVYTSPSSTGSLSYSLVPNASGTATITVTVMDNGGTANGGQNTLTQTFTVTVTPVNQAPIPFTITAPTSINENAGQQTVTLSGIQDGPGDSGNILTVTATSSTPGLIPNPSVTYTSPNQTGSLTFTPVAFTHGSATINVTVTDSGSTAGGGHNSITQSFLVQVQAVNQPPTLDPIANLPTLPANPGLQTVNLTGIGPGNGDGGQVVTVTAASSNTAVVANPIAVVYTSGNSTGTLSFTPVAGASGVTTITVIAQDNGGTANGGINFVAQSFLVAVNPPHLAPVVTTSTGNMAYLQNQAATPIDPGVTVVEPTNNPPVTTLTGVTVAITGNFNSSQDVLGFISQGGITGSYSATTGVLTLTGTASLAAYQTALQSVTYFNSSNFPNGGSVQPVFRTVTFTANDGATINGIGSASRSITITPVNHTPTLGALEDSNGQLLATTVQLHENAGMQLVNLVGISDGDNNAQGILNVTATITSGNSPAVIPTSGPGALTVNYTPSDTTGTLTYTPIAFASGIATITVTVTDGGGTANNATNVVTQTFTVDVGAVNQAPTLDSLSSASTTILENSAAQTINLSGITAGPGETQNLTVSATSSNPAVIPNPAVTYTSPMSTGTLTYAPSPNTSSVLPVTITVTVMDNGGTALGGVDIVTQTFTVIVTPVNNAPTFNAIPNPPTILENNTAPQTVNLSGIVDGTGDIGNTLSVTATSSNPTLIPNTSLAATYTSPNTTGTLTFAALPNASGTATITVTVNDNGKPPGFDTFQQSFVVTVTPINQPPTLDTITAPAPINENAGQQTITLTGIKDGAGDIGNTLTVTATSSYQTVIPNPTVTFPTRNTTTGSLTFTPVANASGTALITVTVSDGGSTDNGGSTTVQQTFTVTVIAVNQPPTIDAIADPSPILENAGLQTINLSGILDGPGDSTTNTLSITATSSNPTLIPNPTLIYSSPNTTGSLTYTPTPFTSGMAVITVTVSDGNALVTGGSNSFQEMFTVVVQPVNQAPTLNPIPNPATLLENATLQTVGLSGIKDGQGDIGNTLTVTATSSNPAVIPTPSVSYVAGSSTGSVSFTPATGISGTAVITVTVSDGGSTDNGGITSVSQSFVVTVVGVNEAPTLDPIANPAPMLQNAGPQTVNLTGITDGPDDTGQTLTVTATSSNPGVVPNPTITYSSPTSSSTTGTLTFTPVQGTSGSATITVTVMDNGGTANGGHDTFSQTFMVTVLPVTQAPTLGTISNVSIAENAGQQTVNLTGIANGAGDTSSTLSITATSSNPTLIPNPMVTYTSPNSTGTLTFTPVADANGSAVITVTLSNGGSTTNGGVNVAIQTFTVTVATINQAPTLDPIVNPPTILENPSTSQTVNLTGITDGNNDNGAESLTVTATSSNPLVIPSPTVNYISPSQTGSISFAPAHNAVGTATIIVTVMNSGGTAGGGFDTISRSFTITILPVNQQPSFTASNPPAVNEDSGMQTVPNFALFNPGGANESSQTATYIITNLSNPGLFDGNLEISSTGTLTYTPAADTAGTSTFTVAVEDNGGTANGGVNLSVPQTFTITVNGVNHAPSFSKGPNETVPENTGAQSLTAWATNISEGQGDTAQTLNFLVSNNDTGLFSVEPAISTDGILTYTPAPGTSGTATVTVALHDNGGTANGGVDTSPSQTFNITVTPGVATPQVVPMAPVSFVQGGTAGNVVVAMFSEVNGGPASDFSATINWGDNTPPTAGTIVQNSASTASAPATYSVLGSHVYANSGAFTITVSIVDHNGGSPINATNVAVATSSSSLLTAQLSAASDSGPSNSDKVTNVSTPTITGITLPGAQLTVVAQSSSGAQTVATGTAGGDGSFAVTFGTLADGTYNFNVTAVPVTQGAPTATTTVGPVVIDTAAPRISSVTLNPKTGQILVTFTDVGDGLYLPSLPSLLNANYVLVGKLTNVTAVSVPSGSVNQETVALTLNHGKKIKTGSIAIVFDAKGVIVIDEAGNPLAATFVTTHPGGNGVPIGPLATKFTIKNGKVVVPKVKKPSLKVKSLSLPAGPLHHHAHSIR